MAFKRKESTVEAVDLNGISAQEAEKRIIAGVKKYATNEANYAKADANTPYLGHVIGMGIESSNLADITMSIERQFLTKMTKRVPVSEGSSEFKLEEGELGKLRILEGQDALAATPGLSVKMLMDAGHMKKDEQYLQDVVSFAYVSATGDGWRMNDALKKMVAKTERLQGAERSESLANLKTLATQAKAYEDQLADPARLAAAKQKTYQSDQAAFDALSSELRVTQDKLKGFTASGDAAKVSQLSAEEAEIKTRLKMAAAKLNVSREVAQAAGTRKPVEQRKVEELRAALRQTVAEADRLT